MHQLDLALCNALADQLGHLVELCAVELVDGKDPPEWVQLVPAGEKIKALDGREFANKTPDAIVAAFNADPRDVPFDWNHATEIRAPKGEKAPASGWIVAMENRGGEIWGRVEWTQAGAESLKTRESRYVSPAFLFDKARNIIRIISAALLNRPALDMPALAHHLPTETTMDPKLLKLLGLTADATPEQIAEAFEKYADAAGKVAAAFEAKNGELAEANAKLSTTETELANARDANPELKKFVPRADYDAAVAKAEEAEESVKATAKETHDKEVETAIASALEAGKIVPATKDYYLGTCATAEGLEDFKSFVKAAPVVGKDSNLDRKKIPGGGAKPPPSKFLKRMNLTAEEFADGAYINGDDDDDDDDE